MLLYMHAWAIAVNVAHTKNPPQHFSFPSPTASEPDFSMTPADHQGSGPSLRPTTQETGRRLPVATTAPPINVLNHHHPLHRNLGRHQDLYSRGSEAQSGSSPTSFSLRDVSGQRAADSRRTPVVQPPTKFTSTPTNTPAEVPHPTTVASSSAEATRESKEPSLDDEGTTTTTITTTTIITTMQSPGKSWRFNSGLLPRLLDWFFFLRQNIDRWVGWSVHRRSAFFFPSEREWICTIIFIYDCSAQQHRQHS